MKLKIKKAWTGLNVESDMRVSAPEFVDVTYALESFNHLLPAGEYEMSTGELADLIEKHFSSSYRRTEYIIDLLRSL